MQWKSDAEIGKFDPPSMEREAASRVPSRSGELGALNGTEIHELRVFLSKVGEVEGAKTLGLSRQAMYRAMAGLGVRAATLAALRKWLAIHGVLYSHLPPQT